MPKIESGKQLEDAEIELLRRWIEQGAEWDDHWAYRTPKKIDFPTTSDDQWPNSIADSYILARLDQESISPAQDADPVTLIRRLHIDLTGLPPKPEAVEDFLEAFFITWSLKSIALRFSCSGAAEPSTRPEHGIKGLESLQGFQSLQEVGLRGFQ